MTNTLIKEMVNIHNYPEATPVAERSLITIGDLHGNALKFLYFLVKQGVVNCTKEQYELFKTIYRKNIDAITQEDIASIKNLCTQFTVNNKHKICLLGDELADRGQNDYFTLLLLDMLHKKSVDVEIMLSNHGYTFIQALEGGEKFDSQNACGDRIFGRSMHQMQDLITAGMITMEEVKQIAKTAYLPKLKLITYTLNSHEEITICHHAAIDPEVILELTKTMGVTFGLNTLNKLSDTIAAINKAFQKNWVETNSIHKLEVDLCSQTIRKTDPITFLLWNRDYATLDYRRLPYKLNYVHGHDSNGPLVEGVYCLDSSLGSAYLFTEGQCGEYKVLVSTLNVQLKEELTAINESIVLKQTKESHYVNRFFANLTNNLSTVNNSFNASLLSFDEENKENSWTCILS